MTIKIAFSVANTAENYERNPKSTARNIHSDDQQGCPVSPG